MTQHELLSLLGPVFCARNSDDGTHKSPLVRAVQNTPQCAVTPWGEVPSAPSKKRRQDHEGAKAGTLLLPRGFEEGFHREGGI